MLRVLFLCTANSARSQIAEALLRHKGGDRFIVASAGISPADRVNPRVVTLLGQMGIDWSNCSPKGLEAVTGQPWDIIITTCDKGRESCPSFPGQPVYAHWSVPDPASAVGSDRDEAFTDAIRLLSWRIDLMLTVRLDSIGRHGVEETLRRVGTEKPDPQSSPSSG